MSQADKLPVWWESRRLTFEICFSFSHVLTRSAGIRDSGGREGTEKEMQKQIWKKYLQIILYFLLKGRKTSQ